MREKPDNWPNWADWEKVYGTPYQDYLKLIRKATRDELRLRPSVHQLLELNSSLQKTRADILGRLALFDARNPSSWSTEKVLDAHRDLASLYETEMDLGAASMHHLNSLSGPLEGKKKKTPLEEATLFLLEEQLFDAESKLMAAIAKKVYFDRCFQKGPLLDRRLPGRQRRPLRHEFRRAILSEVGKFRADSLLSSKNKLNKDEKTFVSNAYIHYRAHLKKTLMPPFGRYGSTMGGFWNAFSTGGETRPIEHLLSVRIREGTEALRQRLHLTRKTILEK